MKKMDELLYVIQRSMVLMIVIKKMAKITSLMKKHYVMPLQVISKIINP